MKTILVTIIATLIAIPSFAQWATPGSDIYNTNTGNVGVGTTTPAAVLHTKPGAVAVTGLSNAVSNSSAFFEGGSPSSWGLSVGYITSGNVLSLQALDRGQTTATTLELNRYGGNVGIGASSSLYRLNVEGSVRGTQIIGEALWTGDGTHGIIRKLNSNIPLLFLTSGGTEEMRIAADGNIGMGTTNPGSYKLAVNGHIRAKEIKVETGWSDFVFEPHYKLLSLKETEQYIKKNGHLPDIPSAKEVEANGIDLGEMNAKLLMKIEELTLHMIALQKEINVLRKNQNKE